MKISTIVKNIDTVFNIFQKSSIGTFLIEKVFFRKKSFYSILSSFGLILIMQLSVYNNVIQWADKVDRQMENAEGWSYLGWLFLSFIVPEGNLILVIMLIIIILGAWIIRYRELSQEKSVEETLIKPLQEKTKNILFQIKMLIPFNGKKIELDRTDEIKNIKENLTNKQVIVLSGEGGIGKTAIIKHLFEEKHEKDIFYVIKGIEFKDKNVWYGHNIQEFIEIHDNFDKKIFVIDSAEKLMDIENIEFFKEFLSALIQHNWKIIFTTRHSYLDDLNYEFMESYQIKPYSIEIKKLSTEKLQELSNQFEFKVPSDEKLKKLILNPFYLNEFLQTYDENEEQNYLDFKNKLWNKMIKKSKIDREECFLKLAFDRATRGSFFVKSKCRVKSLKELTQDGILGKEVAGYFITHDIYEEWALERIIESEFINKINEDSFFVNIGSSLAIRRSFRNWISEKLLLNSEDIKSFIEYIVDNTQVDQFWKDETLIAVLLSDYSDVFFENFEKELFDDSAKLLQRISFLLRIACKEVDNSILEPYKLNIDTLEVFSMFNKAKGSGWESFIKMIYIHKDELGLEYIEFILPVLREWQTKNQKGDTSRKAALIALHYYELINQERYGYGFDEYIKSICDVIIVGSFEIQDEIKAIFEQILTNKWKNHSDDYYKLSEMILSTEYGFPKAFLILKYFPDYVLKLADLFWSYTPKELPRGVFGGSEREEIETAFGLEKYGVSRYYPDSALQTPFYYQLKLHHKDTINFIIDFINKCVEKYSESDWEEVKEVRVYIDDKMTIKQYHSQGLWNMYRGTSSPVMPDILKSIHMALEKYILEVIKNSKQEDVEIFLKYLLMKSKSSSISAIVASTVLAYPDRTFNIAKTLFKTKEFIQADLIRQIKDYSEARFLYGMGYGLNSNNKVYADERLKTCDDKHRNSHLENLFLNYQLFRNEGVSEDEADRRQKKLWKILDDYYKDLPTPNEQLESEKIWSIALARMDRRKQDIELEKVDGGVQLTFNSKLDSEIEKYSKNSQKESSEIFKYNSLYLWSKNKLENNQDYKKYKEFEDNPLLALDKLKELVKTKPEKQSPILQKEVFSDTAIVLIRDFSHILKLEDKELCRDIILELSQLPLKKDYNYQLSDGTDSAIAYLPLLGVGFPGLKDDIKLLLILNLFRDYEIGMSGLNVNDSAIKAIIKFYDEGKIENFVLGYLYLIPKYKKTYTELQKANWNISKSDVLEKFMENYQEDIERFIANKVLIEHLEDISNIQIRRLIVVMKIISRTRGLDNLDSINKVLVQIIQVFSNNIVNDEEDSEFETMDKFIDNFSIILLETNQKKIANYLQPLIDDFKPTKDIASLFTQIILAQNRIKNYENFWYIWSLFENKILETCKNEKYWDIKDVIYAYMLIWSPYGAIWKEEAKEWHSLKEKDKRFFSRISSELNKNSSVLYAISFLLNSIGSSYLNDGVKWISSMIKSNDNLLREKLEVNTIYYLEQLSRKYILKNMQEVKKQKSKKDEILIILNFLVEKGSAIGYKLRENIL